MESPRGMIVKAGALVVGSEILLGRTRDTNTVYLAEQLLDRGIKLQRWVIVPDEPGEIGKELKRFIEDGFDIVVISGGMGPTHDDITVEAVAKALSLPISSNDECYRRMYRKWSQRNPGKALPEEGKSGLQKMANIPLDFDLINNEEGMVEGLVGTVNRGKTLMFILPGVPREYKGIVGTYKFQDYLPRGTGDSITIREIHFRGKESQMARFLSNLQMKYPDVEIGSYPQGPNSVILRITGPREAVEHVVPELSRQVSITEDENARDG
jgi:molybdenum cofactor synthesis domain-containing protein